MHMTVVALFSGSFCGGEETASRVAADLGYRTVARELFASVAARHGVPEDRIVQAVHGATSFFGSLRRDRQRNVALVRLAVAELVCQDNVVLHGFAMHLVAKTVPQVLRVCLVANREHRVRAAMAAQSLPEPKARKLIEHDDRERIQWTQHLFDLGPWDERLYDEIVPMHATPPDKAARLIVENARRSVVQTTPEAVAAADDFLLAATVNVALADRGHDVDVTVSAGHATVLIKKEVLRLEKLEGELKQIASAVPGVQSVQTRLGPRFRAQGLQRDIDLDIPSRVLLVDDEKEFVHTLSERLQARDFESAVAYDGEDALSFVETQVPEVMVLDLKMPGIDGIEVLRRVKQQHPEVEVIILTGHGSEREEAMAAELGAFAYLHKPVDIELLSRRMREAYRKVNERKAEAAAEAGDEDRDE
jgi:two-component system response regulator CpxR